ncbi:AAA family ATPase [Isoalcanivorax pacificus]|uniref:AAA family ATPase n=1 Tax=Isoalcanivorax pacificus TaxID=1306787 RepID=UPI001186D9DE|nr:AAA family ATPase [Isoalcanivorax pacificus]
MHLSRAVVLSGGPGAGKTTLLNALGQAGFPVVPESGRAIIQAQQQQGGRALPWADRQAFARAMLARDSAHYAANDDAEGWVFFDRGIPDIRGYCRVAEIEEPPALDDGITRCRYYPTVFLAPPWPAIYAQDAERRQDFATATTTFEHMRRVYTESGYRTLLLPCCDVAGRRDFVLRALEAGSGTASQQGTGGVPSAGL